jgi:hypothetical protein
VRFNTEKHALVVVIRINRISRTENVDYVSVSRKEKDGDSLTRTHFGCHVVTSSGRRVRIYNTYEPVYNSSRSAAALLEQYPNIPVIRDPQFLPTCVAVHGKTAIAAYITSIQGLSKYQAAEKLEVEPSTVSKYIKRFYNEVRS